MKRTLAGIAIGAAILVAAIAIAIFVGIAALRGESGREWLRTEVVARTRALFAGELRVGKIDGDFTSWIEVHQIELFDREGRRAVAIGSLRAEYALAELIGLRVKSVAVDRLEVQAFTSSTGLNLTQLIAPSPEPPAPSVEPPTPTLSIGELRLSRGWFALDGVTLAEQIDLSLGLAIERGRIEARQLDLQIDGAELSAPLTRFDLTTSALDAALELALPGALVSRLAQDPKLSPEVRLAITAQRASVSSPWEVRLSGTLSDAPLSARASVAADFSRAEVRLALDGIDPNAVYASAPQGRLDLDAIAAIDPQRATVTLDGSGTLTASTASLSLDRLTATATLAEQRATFALALDAGATDQIRSEGALSLADLVLEETTVTVRLTTLRPYLPPSLPIEAQLAVDASASGRLDALSARAKAEVRGLAMPDARVRELDLSLELEGLPGHPSGFARARARGIEAGAVKLASLAAEVKLDREGRGTIAIESGDGRPLSSLDVQGNLHIKSAAEIDVGLSRADAMFRGARLSLAPSFVSYAPDRLDVDAELGSPAGAIRAKVSLDPTALLAGRGTIEISAPDLSLAGAAALLPEPLALAGRASLSVSGEVGPARALAAKLELTDASYRGSAPIAGTLSVYLEEGLSAELALAAGRVASVRAELASRVPKDPLAWQPRDLTRATVTIAPIDLALAAGQAALFGVKDLALSGTASIAAELAPAGDGFAIHSSVMSTVEYQAASAAMALTASVAVPSDPSAWGSLDHRALVGAELSVEPIALAALAPLAGLDPPLGGKIMIEARATAGLQRIDATVSVKALELLQLPELIDAELRLDASPRRANAVGLVRVGSVSALALDATFGAGVGDLAAGASIAERARLDGTVRLLGFPLQVLSSVVDREDAFAGELTGTGTVGGTLSALLGQVELEVKDARFGAMDFDRFRIGATYEPATATADLELVQAIGGSLDVRSKIGLKQPSIELDAKASRFAIDFVNEVLPEQVGLGIGGRIDADLTMSGRPEDLVASGWLSLSEGTVIPPRPLGTIEGLAIEVRAEERSISVEARGRSGDGTLSGQVRSQRSSAGIDLDGTITTDGLPLALGKTPIALDLNAIVDGSITSEETRIDVKISGGEVEVEEQSAREVHPVEPLEDVVFVDARGKRAMLKKRSVETATAGASRLELSISTSKALPVSSRELKASVEADMRISSGRVTGKVSLGEGAIEIGSRDWQIEHARIDFDGSVPPRPVLDVLLIHEFETVVVSIFVTGTPDHPDVRFEASPATYDQAALLGIVLGAEPDEQESGAPLRDKALGAGAGLLVGALRNALGTSLWLDTLAVDFGEQVATPKLQLGKWITRQLFLGYEHNFGATALENQAEAILRYRFLPGWMIESRIGDKAQGLDLFWTKRF